MKKEMVYGANNEVICDDMYKGYNYKIFNLTSHPTAYIEIPKGDILFRKHYDKIPIKCHGGLTYSDNILEIPSGAITKEGPLFAAISNQDVWFIGWDYCHIHDCYYDPTYFPLSEIYNKKWTTDEIVAECHNVIDQIIELNNKKEIHEIMKPIIEIGKVNICDSNNDISVSYLDNKYNKISEYVSDGNYSKYYYDENNNLIKVDNYYKNDKISTDNYSYDTDNGQMNHQDQLYHTNNKSFESSLIEEDDVCMIDDGTLPHVRNTKSFISLSDFPLGKSVAMYTDLNDNKYIVVFDSSSYPIMRINESKQEVEYASYDEMGRVISYTNTEKHIEEDYEYNVVKRTTSIYKQ